MQCTSDHTHKMLLQSGIHETIAGSSSVFVYSALNLSLCCKKIFLSEFIVSTYYKVGCLKDIQKTRGIYLLYWDINVPNKKFLPYLTDPVMIISTKYAQACAKHRSSLHKPFQRAGCIGRLLMCTALQN